MVRNIAPYPIVPIFRDSLEDATQLTEDDGRGTGDDKSSVKVKVESAKSQWKVQNHSVKFKMRLHCSAELSTPKQAFDLAQAKV